MVRIRFDSQNAASQIEDGASPAVVAALRQASENIVEMQENANRKHAELMEKTVQLEKKLDK